MYKNLAYHKIYFCYCSAFSATRSYFGPVIY